MVFEKGKLNVNADFNLPLLTDEILPVFVPI